MTIITTYPLTNLTIIHSFIQNTHHYQVTDETHYINWDVTVEEETVFYQNNLITTVFVTINGNMPSGITNFTFSADFEYNTNPAVHYIKQGSYENLTQTGTIENEFNNPNSVVPETITGNITPIYVSYNGSLSQSQVLPDVQIPQYTP